MASDRERLLVRAVHSMRERAAITLKAIAWNVVVPYLRFRARRRVHRLVSGAVTVVTVNWNSWAYLEVLLRVVQARSPEGTRILVVDNDSSRDESRRHFAEHPEIRAVKLPLNLGHDYGLDVGFLLTETEYVVALDVDAFPLHDRWLASCSRPVAGQGDLGRTSLPPVRAPLLPRHAHRSLRRAGHSFRMHYQPATEDHDMSGDVGENMSEAEADKLHFFDATSRRGPGDVGTVFGDLVYHNFYSTRFDRTLSSTLDGAVNRETLPPPGTRRSSATRSDRPVRMGLQVIAIEGLPMVEPGADLSS